MLEDDRLIEVSAKGDIVWEWVAGDHIDEFGFSDAARKAIKAAPGVNAARGSFDWLHINSATYLGPNHWFDEGDSAVRSQQRHHQLPAGQLSRDCRARRQNRLATRSRLQRIQRNFAPSGRLLASIMRTSSRRACRAPGICWCLITAAPAATASRIRPRPNGANSFARASSRVLEINPVTLELVWSYTGPRFFSSNISGAQRLANGNTLITEGPSGRLFEVTKEGQIVWEYIYPVLAAPICTTVFIAVIASPTTGFRKSSSLERAVVPPALGNFRVP